MSTFKEKYLKYKKKYIELKNKMKGGIGPLKAAIEESKITAAISFLFFDKISSALSSEISSSFSMSFFPSQ